MKFTISISDLGFEQERDLDENIPVHRILYECLDSAKSEGLNRASDVYEDLASYGLYFLPAPNVELDEIPKDHAIRNNHLSLSKKLFVLHRGKKATQNRRRDEETYRIQFETRNDPKMNESNRLDNTQSPSLQNRPKRRRTTLIASTNPPKRQRTTKQVSRKPKQPSKVSIAVSAAEDISKTKKKLQQTRTKRMKQIHARQQKLAPLQPSQISYDLELKHILRCHSKGESNYINDYMTPVYCSVFLPSEVSQNDSSIICTGGAHKICFIDCESGKTLKMFQAAPSESFYCISATYIKKFKGTKSSNDEQQPEKGENTCVVAAAGKQSTIKLINYQRNECYNVLQGHTGNINELAFSPKTPYHLLSASSDESVILWDIRDGGSSLGKFQVGMEVQSLSISVDGSYFVAGGSSFKEKTFGFDLFPLRKGSSSSELSTKSLLHQRSPATSSLVSVDCIRLIDHSTLVCKPHPGNEIIGWSFVREPGKKGLRCVQKFRLQNLHSISQSVHKFCLSEDKSELFVGDRDGGLCVYNIPDDSVDLSNPLPPKIIGYHPQCVDFGLDVCVGKKFVVSTGSMNYIYIWEKVLLERVNNDEMEVEIVQMNEPQQYSGFPPAVSIPGSGGFQTHGGFGWGQPMGHEDFTQLANGTQVVFSDDDDVMDCDDIIVYNNNSQVSNVPYAQVDVEEDEEEITVHF